MKQQRQFLKETRGLVLSLEFALSGRAVFFSKGYVHVRVISLKGVSVLP